MCIRDRKTSSCVNQDTMLHTSVTSADPQKTLKQMLMTCASLVDSVDNQGVFTEIQNRSQKLFEYMLKETIGRSSKENIATTTTVLHINHQQGVNNTQPPNAKRRKKEHSTHGDDTVIIETSTSSVNGCVGVVNDDGGEEDIETKTFSSDD